MNLRIGHGVDFHQFVENRSLWLGGILIPHTHGALGHSDADVLLHAICDALLGAIGAGDIGTHFPDSDTQYKNIDSKILLARSFEQVVKAGYRVMNLDSTLCLQAPKVKPYINAMQETIAKILEIDPSQVSIKATTTEHMGFAGRGEGLFAHAAVLLIKS